MNVARIALAAALVCGCAADPTTQLVVRIQTDLQPHEWPSLVTVRAERILGAEFYAQNFNPALDGGNGRVRFPGEITLVPADQNDSHPFRLEVQAHFAERAAERDFTYRAVARFTPGEKRLLYVVLSAWCTVPANRNTCAATETCGWRRGVGPGCEPVERAQLPGLNTLAVRDDEEFPCLVCDRVRGLCADVLTRRDHCGACGHPCYSDETCVRGRCAPAPSCPSGRSFCDGACRDRENDPDHCGICGLSCADREVCVRGRCVCTPETTLCSGVCRDLRSDLDHCGRCGHVCATGLRCVLGECAR